MDFNFTKGRSNRTCKALCLKFRNWNIDNCAQGTIFVLLEYNGIGVVLSAIELQTQRVFLVFIVLFLLLLHFTCGFLSALWLPLGFTSITLHTQPFVLFMLINYCIIELFLLYLEYCWRVRTKIVFLYFSYQEEKVRKSFLNFSHIFRFL